jgi:hypothetical protein
MLSYYSLDMFSLNLDNTWIWVTIRVLKVLQKSIISQAIGNKNKRKTKWIIEEFDCSNQTKERWMNWVVCLLFTSSTTSKLFCATLFLSVSQLSVYPWLLGPGLVLFCNVFFFKPWWGFSVYAMIGDLTACGWCLCACGGGGGGAAWENLLTSPKVRSDIPGYPPIII